MGVMWIWPAFRALLVRFKRSRRGAIAAFLAVSIVPLVAVTGLAIDTTRGYLVKSRLSAALDAAGLAGGRVMFSPERDGDIQMFFDTNFPPGYMGATLSGPVVTINTSAETLTLDASATIPTSFMSVVGIQDMTVTASTVIRRAAKGMELILVMDNTGSMRSNGKMDAMKGAATDLIDILYGEREVVEDFWVGLVPYTVAVNVGAQHTDWLTGYNPVDYVPTAWKGCVEARPAPFDQTDNAPGTAGEPLWTPFFYPAASDNNWPPVNETNGAQNNGTGPNLGCGPEITPLVPDKTTIQAAIDEMLPWHRGGTMGNLGLVWGWRSISPKWRGVWGAPSPAELPLDYGTPLMEKVVIMLTDGQNQWYDHPPSGPDNSDYGAYGRLGWGILGTTNAGAAETEINARMLAVCTAMKAEGIRIYTITFQQNNGTLQNLYRDCATAPGMYYNSPSNAELQDAFHQIAEDLSNLRIER
ncbi:MAG: pilus assembly protein TadG-related protein [Alphaproteobacteria bacterium]